jgi:hypothetical protein
MGDPAWPSARPVHMYWMLRAASLRGRVLRGLDTLVFQNKPTFLEGKGGYRERLDRLDTDLARDGRTK